MRNLILLLALCVVGCGEGVKKTADPVDISGSVTQGGKPVTDVNLNLQPTGSGQPAIILVTDGAFTAKVIPGSYTYYFTEGSAKTAFGAISEKYHAGAMDRKLAISAGKKLEITLE